MTSDEPDEDAYALDDEKLLEGLTDVDPTRRQPETVVEVPDWPAFPARDIGLSVDIDTLAWFQANHPDWRREMRFVLRGWTLTRKRLRQDSQAIA